MSEKTITSKAARQLAVRYCAYQDAVRAWDPQGTRVWGGLLLEIQDETGVEFYPRSDIERVTEAISREVA